MSIETITLDDIESAPKSSNSKSRERQSEYDSAIKRLTPGGPALVLPVGSGKDSARGLKMRLAYAIKRSGIAGVEVADGKRKSDNAAIVYAHIPAAKPAKTPKNG